MSVEKTSPAADGNVLLSARVFPVSRARLFDAFRNPAELALWWGPKGFTNTFHVFDFQEGGSWRFRMRAPDGTTFENEKTFTRIVPGREISFRHHGPLHHFLMSLHFTDEPGGSGKASRSRMSWRMTFATAAEADKLRGFILPANEENFDRLEAFLTSRDSGSAA